MFEKEAEEYTSNILKSVNCNIGNPRARHINSIDVECAFKDGAEFGYNKANEWHDLRKNLNDLPKESGKYFVAIPNENGFIETDVACFGVSSGWEYFDTFVDEYGREHIIAWKEYPTFL